MLGAWFLYERVTWLDGATMAVALGGMVLFFFDQLTAGGMWGNVLSMASGVSYASLIVLLRTQKDGSPMESALLGNGLTALIGLPFMWQGSPSMTGWLTLIVLGVFQLGLAYVFYSTAIKHVDTLGFGNK